MRNTLKAISLLLITVFILSFSSCLTEEEKIERTFETELIELDAFLAKIIDDGYDLDTTELGVYYLVYEEGEGAYPAEGDELSIKYTGYFTDGNIFDSTSDYYADGIWTFKYMDPEVGLISGMTDGLAIMKKGSKYDLIIPSNLAYGSTGSGVVPPYTTLILSIELIDIQLPAE
ncbi:MAG: FKBP-type peptidyl-prolyl cis-trans isomerase [Bacteroidota bacterium]